MVGPKNFEYTNFSRTMGDIADSPAYPDNSQRELVTDTYGALWVRVVGDIPPVTSSYVSKTYYSSAGLGPEGLVYTGECDLLEFYGFKTQDSQSYLHIFDSVTRPADDTVPLICIPMLGEKIVFSLSNPVLKKANAMFATGVYYAVSSTASELNYDDTVDIWVNAMTGNY